MRSCASGSRSTNRPEQYQSRTRQQGLQVDLPAVHTTVSVMRAVPSHLVNRFLASTLIFVSIQPGCFNMSVLTQLIIKSTHREVRIISFAAREVFSYLPFFWYTAIY